MNELDKKNKRDPNGEQVVHIRAKIWHGLWKGDRREFHQKQNT
jgi:hypothetical protein